MERLCTVYTVVYSAGRDTLHLLLYSLVVRSKVTVPPRHSFFGYHVVRPTSPSHSTANDNEELMSGSGSRLRAYSDCDHLDRYKLPIIGVLAESWVDAE